MPSVRFLRDGEQRRATSGGGELGRPYPRYVTRLLISIVYFLSMVISLLSYIDSRIVNANNYSI